MPEPDERYKDTIPQIHNNGLHDDWLHNPVMLSISQQEGLVGETTSDSHTYYYHTLKLRSHGRQRGDGLQI